MKNLAIQFAELCEMLCELQSGQIVRVTSFEKKLEKTTGGQLTQYALLVAVTTITDSNLVQMCHLHVGTFEHSVNGPFDVAGYQVAVHQAEQLKTAVSNKLESMECKVLGGYCDVPNISNVFGSWAEMKISPI